MRRAWLWTLVACMAALAGWARPGIAPAASATAAPVAVPATALVRLPFPQDDGSLTPYTFDLGYPLLTLIYDTLLWRGPDGEPQPWLATSMVTSNDGRRLTLQLAPGVKWQDGVALSAADVAFTFSYVAAHPQGRFSPEVADVSGVRAIGATTVVIDLAQPSPGFAQSTLDDLPILPAHLWAHLAPGQLTPPGPAMGSGPYRLVSYQPGQGYRLAANLDYFKGPPTVATIEVPIIHDLAGTLSAFQQRRVDMIPLSLPVADTAQVDDFGTRVSTGPSYLGTELEFNLHQVPFDRPQVRRAVAEAIDLAAMAGAVGDAVDASHGFVHPASPWATSQVLHHGDLAGARAVLVPLRLSSLAVLAPDNDPIEMQAAAQVAVALQRAGVAAAPRYLSVTQLKTDMGPGGASPSSGLAITAIDPLISYDPSVLAPELAAGGYHSASFNTLAARVATTTDPSTRRAAVAAELAQVATDVPALPLFFANGSFAYHPAVYDGWVYVKGTGIFDKLSFLASAGAPAGAAPATPGAPAAAPASPGGFSFSILAWAMAGVAAVLAVLLAVAFAFSRRR